MRPVKILPAADMNIPTLALTQVGQNAEVMPHHQRIGGQRVASGVNYRYFTPSRGTCDKFIGWELISSINEPPVGVLTNMRARE